MRARTHSQWMRVTNARTLPEVARVFEQRQGYNESNDCAVVSMSIAFGIPYNVAHDLCAAAGRENGHGMYFTDYLRAKELSGETVCGYKITITRVPRLTLSRVRRDFPKGRFIVRKPRHVFAMIDGKVLDPNGSTDRVIITELVYLERT